ncbi:MAG: metal-binding protein [Beijerinckiaceae bacterium]|nr:metal-binding protein [Beijerinckiaceae bacterium]
MKTFTLTGADGKPIQSPEKGTLGGNRRTKVYGLMECKTAGRYLAAGTYQKNRVFFADEATALSAGYRPCASCLPGRASALASGAAAPVAN